MADKHKSQISAIVRFIDGERPTATKFNALTAQTQRGFYGLEGAVGDLRDESWPYMAGPQEGQVELSRLTISYGRRFDSNVRISEVVDEVVTDASEHGRPLTIANLARLVGPAANLNPKALAGQQNIVKELLLQVDKNDPHPTSATFRYPPLLGEPITFQWVRDGLNVAPPQPLDPLEVRVDNFEGAISAGDYHISSTGVLTSYLPLNDLVNPWDDLLLYVSYTTDASKRAGGSNYQGASFNVIPDHNQIENPSGAGIWDGVRIVLQVDKYVCTLPLARKQQSNYDHKSVSLDDSVDLNYQKQLKLPQALIDAGLVVNQVIPQGFLYLRDALTNKNYTNGTYRWNDEHIVVVDGISIPKEHIDASVENLSRFQIVTVGTDITTSIDDLREKQFLHSHSRKFGEPLVSIKDIDDIYSESSKKGPYLPSTYPGNYLSQYLHRDGYQPSGDLDGLDVDKNAANDNNALRGDLVLGTSHVPLVEGESWDNALEAPRARGYNDAGSYVNQDGKSFRISFGGGPSQILPQEDQEQTGWETSSKTAPQIFRGEDKTLFIQGQVDQAVVDASPDDPETRSSHGIVVGAMGHIQIDNRNFGFTNLRRGLWRREDEQMGPNKQFYAENSDRQFEDEFHSNASQSANSSRGCITLWASEDTNILAAQGNIRIETEPARASDPTVTPAANKGIIIQNNYESGDDDIYTGVGSHKIYISTKAGRIDIGAHEARHVHDPDNEAHHVNFPLTAGDADIILSAERRIVARDGLQMGDDFPRFYPSVPGIPSETVHGRNTMAFNSYGSAVQPQVKTAYVARTVPLIGMHYKNGVPQQSFDHVDEDGVDETWYDIHRWNARIPSPIWPYERSMTNTNANLAKNDKQVLGMTWMVRRSEQYSGRLGMTIPSSKWLSNCSGIGESSYDGGQTNQLPGDLGHSLGMKYPVPFYNGTQGNMGGRDRDAGDFSSGANTGVSSAPIFSPIEVSHRWGSLDGHTDAYGNAGTYYGSAGGGWVEVMINPESPRDVLTPDKPPDEWLWSNRHYGPLADNFELPWAADAWGHTYNHNWLNPYHAFFGSPGSPHVTDDDGFFVRPSWSNNSHGIPFVHLFIDIKVLIFYTDGDNGPWHGDMNALTGQEADWSVPGNEMGGVDPWSGYSGHCPWTPYWGVIS